jgi:hypothetical protein
MTSGQATYVCRVACGDKRSVELESRGYDESVNSVGRGHARLGQEKPRTLGDWLREVKHQDAAVVEETVDGGIEARPPADFAENRSGHANQGAAVMRKGQDSASPVFKDSALRRACQRVYCFGI